MGCKRLTYNEFEPILKVVYSKNLIAKNSHVATFWNSKNLDVNYYPFGSLLPNRHGSTADYRYSMNGQEKVDEIAGEGNHTTAEYWEYDTRLGRRWNQDPRPNPSISNYACFANNPISNSDPKGDTLRVTQDLQSTSDITSIVKAENIQYLQFNSNGTMSLNFGQMSAESKAGILASDEGMNLLNDMVEAVTTMEYSACDTRKIQQMQDGKNYNTNTGPVKYSTAKLNVMQDEEGISNISRNGADAQGENTFLPLENNLDGLILISPKLEVYEAGKLLPRLSVFKKSRASVVFHELAENFERTENGVPYATSWKSTPNARGHSTPSRDPNDRGAHQKAINREKRWHGQSRNPGEGSYQRQINAKSEHKPLG